MVKTRPMTPPSSNNGEMLQNGFQQLLQHNIRTPHQRGGFSYRDSSQLQVDEQPLVGTPTPAPAYHEELAYTNRPMYTYTQQPIGLGIQMDSYGQPVYGQDASLYVLPDDHQQGNFARGSPTPSMSTPGSEIRTRSGLTIKHSTTRSTMENRSRVSKSSKTTRPKKQKLKPEDKKKSGLPKPLSILAQEWPHIPIADINAYVNRPAQERQSEIETGKNAGRVKRPMNSFMLYRKAYQELTKQWALQQNHQVVSQVCGESWPQESTEIREEFKTWAKIERDNHQAAFPGYKFTPAKAGVPKTAKRQDTEEPDSEESDLEDYEWQTGRTTQRKKKKFGRREIGDPDASYYPTSMPYGYESRDSSIEPNLSYHQSSYQTSNPGRPLPIPYEQLHAGQYYTQSIRTGPSPGTEDVLMQKRSTPGSQYPDTPQQTYAPAIHYHQQGVPLSAQQLDPALFGPESLYDEAFAAQSSQYFGNVQATSVPIWQAGYMNPGDLHNDGYGYMIAGPTHDGLQIPDQHLQVLKGQQEGWQVESLDTGREFDKWMDER